MKHSFLLIAIGVLSFLLITAPASFAKDEDFVPEIGGKSYFPNTQNLWGNMKGEDILFLLEQIPNDIDSIERQTVAKLILSPLPENGYERQKDILRVRINALLKLGLFDEAVTLYQVARTSSTSAETHKLGLTASLLAQKIDLTCVEYFVLIEKQILSTWKELEALCESNMKASKTQRDPTNQLLPPALPVFDFVSFDAFQKASLSEKALMIANDDIQTSIPEDLFEDRKAVDALTLTFALKSNRTHTDAYKHTRALLHYYGLVEGDEYEGNLIKPEKLTDLLNTISDPEKPKEERLEALETILSNGLNLPVAYYHDTISQNFLNNVSDLLDRQRLFKAAGLKALSEGNISFLSNVHKTILKDKNMTTPALPFFFLLNKEEYKAKDIKEWQTAYCGETQIFNERLCQSFPKTFRHLINLHQKSYTDFQDYEKLFSLTKKSDYVMSYVGIDGISHKNLTKRGVGTILYSIINGVYYSNMPVFLELDEYKYYYNGTLNEKKQMYVIMKTMYDLSVTKYKEI